MSSTTTEQRASLKQLAKRVKLINQFGAKLDYDKQDDWQKKATGWNCTLRYQGRQHRFDFWQGPAISGEPDREGVLNCLLSDAQAGEQSFDEFCGEFGYDHDSRKAESTWKACQKTTDAIKRLLGSDYETFLYAERD